MIHEIIKRLLSSTGNDRREKPGRNSRQARRSAVRPCVEPMERRTLLSAYTITDLGTLGGTISTANGINASGQVVGYAYTAAGDRHAFLYSNGTMTDLDTLGGTLSIANGINASGQTVGQANPSVFRHACLYSNGTMTDLGTLGGTNSAAAGINASGQVVGSAQVPDGNFHAVLYSNGTVTDLGTLGRNESEANGINASGQVVGNAATPAGFQFQHAFLYSNGTMTDLNTLIPANSGWVLQGAQAINDSGEIVGYGVNPQGQDYHGFIAVPSNDLLLSTTTIGDGSAQRSQVKAVTLTFSSPVTLGSDAFTFTRRNTGGSGLNDGSAATDLTADVSSSNPSGDGKTWVVSFLRNTAAADGSGGLTDGIYNLVVHGAGVAASGGGSIADQTITFHRLFGDINGDGTVNSADYFQFKKAFGAASGSALYNPAFDFDNNGIINSADYFKFKANFGRKFTY